MDYLPTERGMQELTRTPLLADTIARVACGAAIYEAAANNLTDQGSVTTDTVDVSGLSEIQLLVLMGDLRRYGYTVIPATGTITLRWERA